MVPQDEPPAPVDIGFLGQETSTFWGEGAEVVPAPETTADTLASTEPTEASFVAFCRLCERLLATLEPSGKGHFKNREMNLLVNKAFNDPASLTPKQRERFVSAVSKRLGDLSAEVADEFQKSDDHALYTSVVDHFMNHDRPSSKTSKAVKAEPESTEPVAVGVRESVGFVTMLIGFGVTLVGIVWAFDSYVVSQMAGHFCVLVGLLIASVGLKLNGNDKIGTGFLFHTFSEYDSKKVRLIWIVFVTIFTLAYYVY